MVSLSKKKEEKAAGLTAPIRRLRQELHRSRRRTRDYLVAHHPGLYLSLRVRLPPLRRRPHKLPEPLVVSLTSYPPRFGTLALTLHSLLRQTLKPDHLILWIARADAWRLPGSVTALRGRGLEIRLVEDLQSYKKIIPALDEFPQAFIATADDDLYYWPGWLDELTAGLEPGALVIPCHRAHEIRADGEGRFLPYRQWVQHTAWRGKGAHLFPTGMGGVLYPPGVLTHTPADREAGLRLCPQGDDIWLYWIGRRNGAVYKTVGQHRAIEPWPESQVRALWHSNVSDGGNDRQIHLLAEHYGYPGHK